MYETAALFNPVNLQLAPRRAGRTAGDRRARQPNKQFVGAKRTAARHHHPTRL